MGETMNEKNTRTDGTMSPCYSSEMLGNHRMRKLLHTINHYERHPPEAINIKDLITEHTHTPRHETIKDPAWFLSNDFSGH